MKKIKYMIAAGITAVVCLGGCGSSGGTAVRERDEVYTETSHADVNSTTQHTERDIYVYITGRVAKPDVYKVEENCRIYQIVDMAGGFLDDADIRSVNMADKVYDGMKIVVYSVDDNIPPEETGGSVSGGIININAASKTELMTLPGIGESKAESIIKYREKNGGFKNVEDIMNIPGIKEKAFEKIKEMITV